MSPLPEPAFPKLLSHRRAERWIAEHNPYPETDGYAHHSFAASFWNDQADKAGARKLRALVVAAASLALPVLLELIAAIVDLFGGATS